VSEVDVLLTAESNRRLRCYIAAPLFSQAERQFNAALASKLEETLEVYLPQRDGLLIQSVADDGGDLLRVRQEVFRTDLKEICERDIVVAVLDGASVDEGVGFELGYAFAIGKICVGLLTDFRRNERFFRNPMWLGALDVLCSDVHELNQWITSRVGTRLSRRK
jgi:nucleoside 2-deoxyribosyltransferase